MASTLEQLLILQDRDSKLRRTLLDLKNLPSEQKAIADRLATQTKNHEALRLKARQVEAERKDLEAQATTLREKIAKYAAQQLQTKKNEEYQALGHEIERAKTDISSIEDKEIELMEAYEAAQKAVAAEAVHVKEFEQAATQRTADLKVRQETLEKQKAALEAEIRVLEPSIEAATLARYRRILASKGDIALVPVEHGTTCGGCHMKLTHQTVLHAKGGNSPATCDNCGRLLYWLSDFA